MNHFLRNLYKMKYQRWIAVAIVGLVLGVGFWGWYGLSPDREVDFNRDIRPIFNEQCITCHGGVKAESGFSLLFEADAMSPNESGKVAIIPGDPGASEMIRRVTHSDPQKRMPAEGPPLRDEEIEKLKSWIAAGAKWDRHWAYVLPSRVPPPAVKDTSWPHNAIDFFVLARLESEGLQPSPPADCATLIRRVSLDLTGLPPHPGQVQFYCENPSPESYEKVVDELLDSPHFGERWASMWLDLARYADSKGYEADRYRSIWKYRDWVIRAFNQDLPFDRFTTDQLAGDLLSDPDEWQMIATAFHRNTMTNDEGGTDDEEFRIAAVVDRLNTTMEVWQGTTMACAQCHSHPFDPFRQREYYQLFAFFNNTQDTDRVDEKPKFYSFPDELEEEGRRRVDEIRDLEAQLQAAALTSVVIDERREWEKRLRAVLEVNPKPSIFEDQIIPPRVLEAVKVPESERTKEQRIRLDDFYVQLAPSQEELRKRLEARQEALAKLEPIETPVLRELREERKRKTYFFERGNWMLRGDEVRPGVPETLNPLDDGEVQDRLRLARWLVSPENPLTARVAVNRFWAKLFGKGIVETPEDFGTRGARPTHLELLDWLALEFREEHGWSVKKLLKQLVSSSTYQQSSRLTPQLQERDPQNRFLARAARIRLGGEQLRDQALAVSGLLSTKMFGPSVMPPQPEGLWNNPYDDAEWITSEGSDRHRRAIYTYWRRTNPYPSMIIFDAPSREVCVSRRIQTNTPLQALVTLNDPVYVEAAQALAGRMMQAEGSGAQQQLRAGYRLALMQDPDAETLEILEGLYSNSFRHYSENAEESAALAGLDTAGAERAALTVVANAILNLDEFLTRE